VSATPILDLEQEPPAGMRRWVVRSISVALGLLLGGALILHDEGLLGDWSVPFNGLLFFPALLFAIAIHESGHALGGAAVGLKNGGMAVGPLLFWKGTTGWHFRFNWQCLMGGYYRPLADLNSFRPRAAAFMIACGPLADLSMVLVCATLLRQGVRSEWWGTLFCIECLLLALNCIPYSTGSSKNDGARFRQLLFRPAEARSWIALMELQTQDARGLKPAEYDDVAFQTAMEFVLEANEYWYCRYLAFYRSIDQGKPELALLHLEDALSRSGRSGNAVQRVLYSEAAFASTALLGKAEQAKVWRARAVRAQKSPPLDAVDAAIAMAECRYADALAFFEKARLRVQQRKVDSGMVKFALAEWAIYEDRCREGLRKDEVGISAENCRM